MIIKSVVKRQDASYKNSQWRLFWLCSDGIERSTKEVANFVGLHESTIIKRWHVYGIHWLITHNGPIDKALHNKYKLADHKQYHPQVIEQHVLKTKSGKIIPQQGKYDYLIPCPPAAKGSPIRDNSKRGVQQTDEESTYEAINKLKKFNKKMIAKGYLPESGTLVNPRFPSGLEGKHNQGIPCNI